MDTIFALATARGKAGLAVVRVSGPRASDVLQCFGCKPVQPRRTALRNLIDRDGGLLDQALVVLFQAGASFTGEAVVELHLHGSPAIVDQVLRILSGLEGLRMAEPGEFTRRALENDVLDVAQVEGLSDLLDAETEAQRKQAVRVFSGALGELVEGWRSALLRAAALLEATIDFADEEVPTDVYPEVRELLEGVRAELTREVAGSYVSERIRDGFEVALVGPPNAGKSSLLNRLAGREAAITSEIAGTTRDVIEVRLDLAGLSVTVLDTAGLRETEDQLEEMGIARAKERAEMADLRVFLSESGVPDGKVTAQVGDIFVRSKSDLSGGDKGLPVSSKTGAGVSKLVDRISQELQNRASGSATATRARHRTSMKHALAALALAENQINAGASEELVAVEVRSATAALEQIVGRIDVEGVLGEIFSNFCIGK